MAKRHKHSGDGRYERELRHLQEELVKLQYWVRQESIKVAILLEGRDAAGSQWYFPRWAAHLPAAGEVVLFDRSWYTRALTEHVMGFCSDDEYQEFLRSCPQFEAMLARSGMTLLKYSFSVSDEVQEERFQARAADPRRRWKLSPMDIASRDRWVDFSRAKDSMFEYTDTKRSPWNVVDADNKPSARLNCISHILQSLQYNDVLPPPLQLPPRYAAARLRPPPIDEQKFVPRRF